MSSNNVTTDCVPRGGLTNWMENMGNQTGRCDGIFNGPTASVLSECCTFNGISVYASNTSVAVNQQQIFKLCTYSSCMVQSSSDFETMKTCVKDKWDIMKENGTEVESSKIPVCWVENQSNQSAEASAAVRVEVGNRMSWTGIGMLASAIVSAVMLAV